MIDLIELGEICEFLDNKRVPVTESDRKPGPYPYYGANGLQGWIDGFIFDEPLILLAEDGGAFGSKTKPIAYKVTGKCWVNNHAHVLRVLPNCDFDYLCHVLSFYDVTKYVNGTTRQKLTKSEAELIPIPFPPLIEQRRIAALLDKADKLRRTRRYAAQLSDTFLQAVFVRMFGEPITNPRQWEKLTLEELGKVTTGSTPPSVNDGMFGGAIPFVTPGDLEVNTRQSKRFVTEQGAEQSRTVRGGSTLVCCIGATIGKMDKARARCAFNQQINAVEWDTRINDDFALVMMRFYADFIAARGTSTTLPILKKSEFEEIAVPVPPLALQEKFARIVQQFERLRAQQREAERQAEHLFQTLLHRAFSGEG